MPSMAIGIIPCTLNDNMLVQFIYAQALSVQAAALKAGVLIGCAAMLTQPARPQGRNMPEGNTELIRLILDGRKSEAGALARSLGPAAGNSLLEVSSNGKASVRMLALELAGANPSPGSCRTILGRLSDSNGTIRGVAAA